MTPKKREILIIDDSVDAIKILINVLSPVYTVYFATDGQKGVELVKKKKPDLILLDIMMEGLDGYAVCTLLKADPETMDIPVIFLTAVSEYMDEAKAFEIGGADYITKPYVPTVVLARIGNHIKLAEYLVELKRLYTLALDANPITGLPGNNSIQKAVESALKKKKAVYVFYADLDNFKVYNDTYGFAKGDQVILFTALLFEKVVKQMAISEYFIGHIGGDDFVIILQKDKALDYARHLIEAFDQGIKAYYSNEDVSNGFIRAKNRQAENVTFPLVSISIAGVDLTDNSVCSYLEINDICAELKSQAKKTSGSCLMVERRAGTCSQ